MLRGLLRCCAVCVAAAGFASQSLFWYIFRSSHTREFAMNVLCLVGPAGAGKSTVAQAIRDEYIGVSVLKFATPLKRMLGALGLGREELEGSLKELNCPKLYGHSPRHAMQTLGTEWGRNIMGENFWVDQMLQAIEQGKDPALQRIVIDDARFPNEITELARAGHKVKVIHLEPKFQGFETTALSGHASESGLSRLAHKSVNNGNLEETVAEIWDYWTLSIQD